MFLKPDYKTCHTTRQYIQLLRETFITHEKGYLGKRKEDHITSIFDTFKEKTPDDSNYEYVALEPYELEQCRHNPRMFSQMYYGTPDFDKIIMDINELDGPGEFLDNLDKPIRVQTKGFLENYLTTVYTLVENRRQVVSSYDNW